MNDSRIDIIAERTINKYGGKNGRRLSAPEVDAGDRKPSNKCY